MAPEMFLQSGYGKAVDWWALGTLLFEMICGLPPFYDKDQEVMKRRIVSQPLTFTKGVTISEPAKELIRGLLDRKVDSRIGSVGGANDLKSSKFFESLNFNRVMAKQYEPEFRPSPLRFFKDIRNYPVEFTEIDPAETPIIDWHKLTGSEKFDGQLGLPPYS